MPAQADNWNVIINGAWNLAILTPDGIRKRLFNLPEGTPIQLEVAIDRPGSFRAVHESLIVVPSSLQLEVTMQTSDFQSLDKASQIGQLALINLPETPVSAAGINIRYSLTPVPDELIDLLKTPIDDIYSDGGFTIGDSTTRRSLDLQPGVVNVEIIQDREGLGSVLFNFHHASNSPDELREWLGRASEFMDATKKLLELMDIQIQQG